eukprot:TRINITY_DN2796_c3_g1_i3.p1 TRINITY_DN2796_c3_g1~~TRINITY_DN2796_c3_g1_i3.p1  ORF type:complete len:309 (+),score=50.47 TRINITY_DN2796_c3_g1_i3:125-928(+)
MFRVALFTAVLMVPIATGESGNCEVMVMQEAVCENGYMGVTYEELGTCSQYLCSNVMGSLDTARCDDSEHVLVGSNYGCSVFHWNGTVVKNVICKPVPPPPEICSLLSRNKTQGPCQDGSAPIPFTTLKTCSRTICDKLMTDWEVVRGLSTSHVLKGNAYGCQVEPWDDKQSVATTICMPTGSSGGDNVSNGMVLIIIITGTTAAYFFGGLILNAIIGERSLTGLIPHFAFWAALPGLVVDGFLFCVGKKRTRYEYIPGEDGSVTAE